MWGRLLVFGTTNKLSRPPCGYTKLGMTVEERGFTDKENTARNMYDKKEGVDGVRERRLVHNDTTYGSAVEVGK